ncbi:MAG: hypothetical protein HY678_05990, partial [Chloroflexi bacterium]|nr:hypothetical protein [Chloroflexota bacterium]
MNDGQPRFATDEDVPGRILSVLRDARKYVILVSPYLGLWGHAQDAIQIAVRNRVGVTVVLRKEPEVLNSEDVGWLLDNGVKVAAVEDLHAKIYLNESSVVLSSMNLTRGSTQKSLDFAVVLQQSELGESVREYVNRTVLPLADEVKAAGKVTQFFARIADAVRGYCIRCGRAIPKNNDKPMCDECYEVWAGYKKRDYVEKTCHSCGQAAAISYAKP